MLTNRLVERPSRPPSHDHCLCYMSAVSARLATVVICGPGRYAGGRIKRPEKGGTAMAVDGNKLMELTGKMLGDVGAAMGAALVVLGDELGFYKTLAAAGPLSSAELASKTGTVERYVREWAAAQAAAGYINYDAASGRFSISPEQALVLADENGPTFFPAMYEVVAASILDQPKVEAAFRNGGGVGWHEHHPCLFRGTERF